MTRAKRVPGERPLFWIGSSKDDLLTFPEAVKDELGTALSVAQFGGETSKYETLEGFRTRRLRVTRIPKEIPEWNKDAQTTRRTDCTAASLGEAALRGATWHREEINQKWLRVPAMYLLIWVC